MILKDNQYILKMNEYPSDMPLFLWRVHNVLCTLLGWAVNAPADPHYTGALLSTSVTLFELKL